MRYLIDLVGADRVMLGSASWYLVLALGTNAMFQNLQKARLDRLNILARIREHRDLVFVDQRGTGLSDRVGRRAGAPDRREVRACT